MKVHQGNRGKGFEEVLNTANFQYKNRGIALINKRPTPIKVLKTKGVHILKAVWESKSTVDYDGIWKGRSIQFEAKTTNKKRFDLDMLTPGQISFLDQAEKQGAISFVLVEIRPIQSVFLIPNNMVQKYTRNAQKGGRKSIPLDELEVYADVVQQNRGIVLDYLAVVDKHIKALSG
ncbi:recombination protein U [Alteribacillus persepolensis]|uniref:Holliday junction resolvase RecU n=1 Tax=Alteribacillus persepolensis TaxID=568899 RepID=A0A1G8II03_9BACI|nr:Holliday junction resolvase RecU [Alteribacillus persepolensis]SDI18534.1 recombination protein U [Alteribacillus persepolensis]